MDDVGTQGGLDIGSTGNDYSADVWARARFYAQFDEFGSAAEVEAAANATPETSEQSEGGLWGTIKGWASSAADTVGDVLGGGPQ